MFNPTLYTDGYKLGHIYQYPEGTQRVYANWTARGSRIQGVDSVVNFGLQYALKNLTENFQVGFFDRPEEEVVGEYQAMLDSYLGPNNKGSEHIRALHRLGYLPLEIKALPEGTRVPLRVPMLTVENTVDEFFWLTNYFETFLSAELWMPMTSATIAGRIRENLNAWAIKTGESIEGVAFQGHDFSMRGMAGLDAAVISAMGHLVAFTGTETVPVLGAIQHYYPTDEFIAGTVPATEHSVMCAGGEDSEIDTIRRLMRIYPADILSVVVDTWDYWNVVENILRELKDEIIERNRTHGGKLVIRPDSGDPADIICGAPNGRREGWDEWIPTYAAFGEGKTVQEKGSIEALWDIFGGTVNEAGYKVLDPCIGLIYGDAMNYDRIDEICSRLAAKGFASTNWVAGIGSFNYQYQTRDTFGFAMKATNVVIDGEEKAIFKDPVTDNGLKKSLKGRIEVIDNGFGLQAIDSTMLRDSSDVDLPDLLTTVFKDGKFVKEWTFDEVRKNFLAGA